MAAGFRLGIDFGTSHTVALIASPDGRVRPLLIDGSPLLPSSVYAQADGRLLVGRDAVHAARMDPARFEPSPKRRIDDGTVLLGDRELSVVELIAAVLSRVAHEATRVGGGPPSEVTLTHPAAWGVSRRLALVEGAKLASLPQPILMPEPVAAAHYFAGVLGRELAPDQGLLVYDFGGGTFDASMVSRTGDGFDVRAVDGIDDLGGLDLDQLIVDQARAQLPDEALWQRLMSPQTTEDRRHRRLLWDDARITKEMLSRSESATLHIPIAAADLMVTRAAFEQAARPLLEQTVRTTTAVLRWSGLDRSRLAGVFLVGGSSRIPLVATLLEREIGIPPTAIEQPEIVVGEGSLRAAVPNRAAMPNRASMATPAGMPHAGMPRPAVMQPAPAPTSPPPQPISAPPVHPISPVHPVNPVHPMSPAHPTSPAHAMHAANHAPPPVAPPNTTLPNNNLPVWPVAAYPTPAGQPQVYRASAGAPVHPAHPAQSVPNQQPPPRRNVLIPVLASLLVLSLAFAGYLIFRSNDGDPTDVNANPSSSATPAPQPPYQRQARPEWVPGGWDQIPRYTASDLWFTRPEEQGRCETTGDQMRVTAPASALTGCTLKQPLDGRPVTDVAVEVEVTVTSGCAGLWARTGSEGYFLTVCRGYARLHAMGDDAPSADNTLKEWGIAGPEPGTVVGLLVQGETLTVHIAGRPLSPSVNSNRIRRGKVNAGALGTANTPADVTFKDYRVFVPSGGQPNEPARTNSPSPSASTSPSTPPSRTPPSASARVVAPSATPR